MTVLAISAHRCASRPLSMRTHWTPSMSVLLRLSLTPFLFSCIRDDWFLEPISDILLSYSLPLSGHHHFTFVTICPSIHLINNLSFVNASPFFLHEVYQTDVSDIIGISDPVLLFAVAGNIGHANIFMSDFQFLTCSCYYEVRGHSALLSLDTGLTYGDRYILLLNSFSRNLSFCGLQ